MGPTTIRKKNLKTRLYFLVMKKYLRLTLFSVAFISCILVLVYRHKYSDLNVVLQMMNAISGRQSTDSNCLKRCQELSKTAKSDWNTVETSAGVPIWTEIFHGIHTYSAVWLKNQVRVVAYVDNIPRGDIEKLKCQLMYTNTSSVILPAKVQLFQKNKGSLFVIFNCQAITGHLSIPYGVRFEQHNISSAIILPVTSKTDNIGMFSMCVEPLPVNFIDSFRLIEYLIYHHHIGVDHFVFYDKGLTPTMKQIMLEIAPKNHIFVTLLPWNVPSGYQSASRSGAEYFVDCVLRVSSRNYSSFIVRGNINRFVVTKEPRNLTMLMSDRKLVSDPPRIQEENFCMEYPDDMIARSLKIPFVTLLKTRISQTEGGIYPVIYNVAVLKEMLDSADFNVSLLKGFPQKSTTLPKHAAVLHSYENCNKSVDVLEKNLVVDKYMWKYKNLLFKSRLFSLAKQHNLISLD